MSSFLISRLKVVKLIEYSFEVCTSFNKPAGGRVFPCIKNRERQAEAATVDMSVGNCDDRRSPSHPLPATFLIEFFRDTAAQLSQHATPVDNGLSCLSEENDITSIPPSLELQRQLLLQIQVDSLQRCITYVFPRAQSFVVCIMFARSFALHDKCLLNASQSFCHIRPPPDDTMKETQIVQLWRWKTPS